MRSRTQERERCAGRTPLAIVVEGVSAQWQINVIQVLAAPASTPVAVEGYGIVNAAGFSLSPDQARRLAAQILELLGREPEEIG
ncbi:MAG TPA: hypothetical protein VH639_25920 [Bryobacteraceae bacterium]|jgi:hypothetical protein